MSTKPVTTPGNGLETALDEAPFKVVCAWGRPGQGKTIFGLTSPWQPILVLDTENSARLYRGHFQFTWVDCSDWATLKSAFQKLLSKTEPGRYKTLVIDTGTQWAQWLSVDWERLRDEERFVDTLKPTLDPGLERAIERQEER